MCTYMYMHIFKSDHYYINAIYPLVVACHSTCLEMPRIAQFCTLFGKNFLGEDPGQDPPFNTILIRIVHNAIA